MKTKLCRKCKRVKPLKEMVQNARCNGGYESQCRSCNAETCRLWREKNRRYSIGKVPCEFCDGMTSSKEGVCSNCVRESVRMFGDRINHYDANMIEHRNKETRRIRDSFNCVCSVETRLRMKRIWKKMEDNGLAEEANQYRPEETAELQQDSCRLVAV